MDVSFTHALFASAASFACIFYFCGFITRVYTFGVWFCVDDVANFHLRNGASCYRLNWAGDGSSAGRARAAGLMVNYLYASSVHARYEEGDTTGEASKVNEYSNSSEDSNKSEKKVGRRWRVSVGPDIAEILSQV